MLELIRMAPYENRVELEWRYEGPQAAFTAVTRSGKSCTFPADTRCGTVDGLFCGVEDEITLTANDESVTRPFRTGYVPGTVVNYIHPEDYTFMPSGRSPASPAMVRLPSGELIATHDVFWGGCAQNLSFAFASKDDGKTWAYRSRIDHCFWGTLFYHKEALYLIGHDGEYGDLLIFCSKDSAHSWSEPVKLMDGKHLGPGPQKTPQPPYLYKGRLWMSIEWGSWDIGGHSEATLSVDAEGDPMDPAAWKCTPFVPYDESWPGACNPSNGLLEGNIITAPDGQLKSLLRYQTERSETRFGKAVLMDVHGAEEPMTFDRVIDFPGNLSKFIIIFDEKTERYYSLVNRVTRPDFPAQRNVLTLISSKDLIHWRIDRDIFNFEDNGWYEPTEKVGFQYVCWFIEGEDILALSRTALNGAFNFHNANYLTFHRIKNFREAGYFRED